MAKTTGKTQAPKSKYRERLDREREEGKREGSLDAREQALRNSRNASGSRKGGKGSRLPAPFRRLTPGNAQNALLAEEIITVMAIGAYDLQQAAKGSGRKLPAAGPIVSAFAFYAILALIGSFGAQAARVVAAIGGVVTLTTVVTGARGQGLVGLLRKLTGQAALSNTAASG